MPVHIFIQGEKFSNTHNIVQWIATRTGWPVVTDNDLIQQAGSRFGILAEQIERDLYRQNAVMNRTIRRRKRAKALLERSLAESLRGEAGILWGMAGHLIPKKMPHILRVLVTADSADRTRRAYRDQNIPEREAGRQIKKIDRRFFQRHRHLFGDDYFNAASYDVVIPTSVLDTESAALLILEHLTEKAKAAPDDIGKALDDFALAADVQLMLAEKRYDVATSAANGHVTLTVERRVSRLAKRATDLKRLVAGMPGVVDVDVKVGRNFYCTDIYRRCRFELSPGWQFANYAKHRRYLRHSAIRNLPADIKKQPLPNQIGLGSSLSL